MTNPQQETRASGGRAVWHHYTDSDFDASWCCNLASGKFAVVLSKKHENGNILVLKRHRDDQPSNLANNMRTRELGVLQRVNYKECPNVVELKGLYMAENKLKGLLFENAELGNWGEFLQKYEPLVRQNGGTLHEIRCFHAMCISQALSYLKSFGVIHNNLELSNVLVFRSGLRAKLCGFSGALWAGNVPDDCRELRSVTGNLAAPELATPDQRPTFETDIYSFGAVLFNAFIGEKTPSPFDSDFSHEMLLIEVEDYLQKLRNFSEGDRIISLILSCLSKSPQERPSIDNVKEEVESIVSKMLDELKTQKKTVKALLYENLLSRSESHTSISPSVSSTITPSVSAHSGEPELRESFHFSCTESEMDGRRFAGIGVDDFLRQHSGSGCFQCSRCGWQPFSMSTPTSCGHQVEGVDAQQLTSPDAKPTQGWIRSIIYSSDVQTYWRSILLHLGLAQVDIDSVNNYEAKLNGDNPKETIDKPSIVYFALDQVWLERNYDSASRRRLMNALIDCKCFKSANILLNQPDDVD